MRGYQNSLLDPEQSVVVIIDHQPQMYFGIGSGSRECIENSVVGLVKSTKVFQVPCIFTTVEAKEFSGNMIEKIQEIYPKDKPIDRTMINCWEDEKLKSAVEDTKRPKIILSGLWTEACVAFPALCLIEDGYEVYVVVDACGGVSKEVHKTAIKRMAKAGAKLVTWLQVMLEWQRDWANKDTYDDVMTIIKDHAGAYGRGVEYAESML